MEIFGFNDNFSFLSNFYKCTVKYLDLSFDSAEAAYQAAKCDNPTDRYLFVGINSKDAKKIGRKINIRPHWNKHRERVMEEIIYAKFTQNDDLKLKLLDTGDATIIEANTWNDIYWGVDRDTRKGQNRLGETLMKVRENLRKTKPS